MDAPDSAAARSAPGNAANTSGAAASSTMERQNSQSSVHKVSHIAAHRQSFAENQRYPPPSPRNQRHPSFTQQALQELMNHPPSNRHPNPRYAGRDWRDIALGELVVPEDVRWADLDLSVQDATMLLLRHNPTNVVLVRESPSSKTAVSTFDYSDLNAYLLVVVGLAKPEDEDISLYAEIAKKAQSQEDIPLREIQSLARKEELVTLPADATLDKAVEAFGGGIHRVLIANSAGDVVGVLSQLRLVEFFWNEAVNFPVIERLYGCLLRDLQIGTHQIIAINLDRPLTDALLLMHNEGLTSVAVVDQGLNVVGNISTADVKHLTSAASLPLLNNSCMNFISVILSERGVEHGRDSFPVFHVNPYSTLGHTVAKLVATKSHRMWVVESASPSPSAPATPLLQPSHPAAPSPAPAPGGAAVGSPPPSATVIIPPPGNAPPPQSPQPNQTFATAVIPSGLPGARLSGRLTGVVSLTDILNLFAKSSGLRPSDPAEQRARRRRSSSSSVRPSLDSARASVDLRR
ncbi:d2e6ab78-1b73-4d2a-9532-ccbb0b92164d [Thermothielavioides terrestris]|uniref:Protein SDS23 n=1 Tax=Thermothielavioides terrestris TaxID=2587410 RepID=A0A446BTH7_9PEZI|nr:d2e6ab78-1b73-4d2a-9532-ccbb0b92164d [Thermothielavioides terrestris]